MTVSQFGQPWYVGTQEQQRWLAATCPKVAAIIQRRSRSDSIQLALLAEVGYLAGDSALKRARGAGRETRRERAGERRGPRRLPDVTVLDTGSSKHRHAACNSRRGGDDVDDERCFPRSLASTPFPPLFGL